jgi:hypothetical protein
VLHSLSIMHEVLWWSGGIAPPLLTSALNGGEWSASRSGRITAEERTLCARWVGAGGPYSQSQRIGEENKVVPTGNRTPAAQPVVHRYTD